jgi:hypothetical protein
MESSEERPDFALVPPEPYEARTPTHGRADAREDRRAAGVAHDTGAKGGLVSDVFYDPQYVRVEFSRLFKMQARRLEAAFPQVSATSRALLANVRGEVTDFSEVFVNNRGDVRQQPIGSPRRSRRP